MSTAKPTGKQKRLLTQKSLNRASRHPSHTNLKAVPSKSIQNKEDLGQDILKEVESAILSIKPVLKPEKWAAKNYIGAGQSKLLFLDLKIPDVRHIYKKNNFSFSCLSFLQQAQAWDFVWKNSNYFEVMLLPLFWAASLQDSELFTIRKTLISWVDRIDNWAHSDSLSQIYARLFEAHPKIFEPLYDRWSKSNNPWERRQSLVGLLYYSTQRREHAPFSLMKKYILRLLKDEHFYVQKGLGWAVRETFNVYPRQTQDLLLQIAEKIPAAGWTAATEKLSPAFKNKLKLKRKKRQS